MLKPFRFGYRIINQIFWTETLRPHCPWDALYWITYHFCLCHVFQTRPSGILGNWEKTGSNPSVWLLWLASSSSDECFPSDAVKCKSNSSLVFICARYLVSDAGTWKSSLLETTARIIGVIVVALCLLSFLLPPIGSGCRRCPRGVLGAGGAEMQKPLTSGTRNLQAPRVKPESGGSGVE